MMTSVLVASISSGLIALILAVLLIFSSKIFKVEVDDQVLTAEDAVLLVVHSLLRL